LASSLFLYSSRSMVMAVLLLDYYNQKHQHHGGVSASCRR